MINGIRQIDMDSNILSDLNGSKPAKVSDNVIEGMRKYYENGRINDTSNNKTKNRERVQRLYNRLSGIKPIDNMINDVVYVNKHIERGLVFNQSINAIRQSWVEFRLIYNELNLNKPTIKTKKEPEKKSNKKADSYILDNFDNLFDRLSKNVNGVDRYIDDLYEMRSNINTSNESLEKNKNDLLKNKLSFDSYLKDERKSLEAERKAFEKEKEKMLKEIEDKNKELAVRFSKLQELIENVNKKLSNISD